MKNFRLTENFTFPKTTAEKVTANLKAIQLLKELETNAAQATEEQQAILAHYVGWGGLANEFFDCYKSKFQAQREELQALVTADEYRAMEMSSLTAYYTDPMITREMWQYFVNSGFKGGNILDPSMGTGIFFATMPEEIMAHSTLYGVELDPITGAIAKQLFPEATILLQGFETTNFAGQPFDLVISNIPFGDIRVIDRASKMSYLIHDFFVKRACELVHDTGAVAFITSIGTADKTSKSILKEIGEVMAFKGGVRLPSNAFKSIAGTTVTSDILILQKNLTKDLPSEAIFFEPPVKSTLDAQGRLHINPYFDVEHHGSQQVLGSYSVRYFNGVTLSVKPNPDVSLQEQMVAAMDRILPIQINRTDEEVRFNAISDSSLDLITKLGIRPYEYACDNLGTVYYRDNERVRKSSKPGELTFYQTDNGTFVSWDKKHSEKVLAEFEKLSSEDEGCVIERFVHNKPVQRGSYQGLYKGTLFYERPLSALENERIRGMVGIKEAYQEVIDIQIDSEYSSDDFQTLLKRLNSRYDQFVKKYGFINDVANARVFERDDRFSLIASLEEEVVDENDSSKVTYIKAEVFRRALIRPQKAIMQVANAEEALNLSLSQGRGVDFEFMKAVLPNWENEGLLLSLSDRIFIDPQRYFLESNVVWVLKEELLSGEVLSKKKIVQELIKKGDTRQNWEEYLAMLEAAEPIPVTLVDIECSIASNWIPNQILGAFAYKILTGKTVDIDSEEAIEAIKTTSLGRSLSSELVRVARASYENRKMGIQLHDYIGGYRDGYKIFAYLLDANQPTIMTNAGTDLEPKMVVNEVATAELREIENKFQAEFQEFISSNDDLKEMVEQTFNRRFNSYVNREYDGSHLTIDGLAKGISLRQHQLDAVQRILEDRRALLAHEVGTGKTLTMISAGFKLKELGIINRPVFVVPSSLTAQFGQEIMRFYPTKRVFVTTERDFERARRRLFIARMITGDYDAIVIGHSQFEKIKVSEDYQANFYRSKLDEIEALIDYAKQEEDKITFKQAMGIKNKFEKQLETLLDQTSNPDEFIEFEQLGIDMLFVDEAHGYKNVRPYTRLGNVAGIGTTTAKKNLDMMMKIGLIHQEHNYRNVVFATGTPVSNSISEMYTMMSYIQPDVLEEHGLENFDSWVGSFGIIENNLEINPTGDKFISRKRFTKFNNLPELMRIYRRTADIRMTDDLDLPIPESEKFAIKSELTEAQKLALDNLVARTERIKGGGFDPSEDNMLKITLEARKLALDMRLLDSEAYELQDNNKMLQVVDNVEKIYRREDINKGTQMIFSDIGTPNNGQFSIYQELKDLLVDRGIPSEHIAFIHDANNKESRLQLQRKMNAGDIRILIASTEKGGTGLNVQERMKAVHHLDVPWKPSDVIQRNGRLVRQGNKYKKVQIFHYITTGSFDNYLWQIQETKLKYISQIMTSQTPVRSAEDIDEQTMTASDFKAIATGNPYLKMKMEIDNEAELLLKRKIAWQRDMEYQKKRYKQSQETLVSLSRQIEGVRVDAQQAALTKSYIEVVDGEKVTRNPFTMTFASGLVFDKKDVAGNQLAFDIQTNLSEVQKLTTIATYRGFKIKALTHDKMLREGELVKVYIVGQNQYPVDLDFSSAIGTITRIDNVINNLERLLKSKENDLIYHDNVVKKGLTLENFEYQERLDYLLRKQKVISPLIEAEAEVSEIREELERFENEYGTASTTQSSSETFKEFFDADAEEVEHLDPVKDWSLVDEFIIEAKEFLMAIHSTRETISNSKVKEEEIVHLYHLQNDSLAEQLVLF